MKKKKEESLSNGCLVSLVSFSAVFIMFALKIFNVEIPWIFIIIAIIVGIIGFLAEQTANVSKQNESFKKQGLDPKKFLSAGKYISGHINLDKSFEGAFIYPTDKVLKIYGLNPGTGLKDFKTNIDLEKITNVAIEDETTISKRVGLKRMIAIGIFAFAVKKKEKKELAYLVIDWKEDGFTHETVFEFEFKGAVQQANMIRNSIIRAMKQGAD